MSDKPKIKKKSDTVTVPRDVWELRKRQADDIKRFAKMLCEKVENFQAEIKNDCLKV